MAKKKTYRDIDKGRIIIFGDKLYHWQRLDENGVQVDGSGPARNGVEGKTKLVAELKKRFPDDDFEGT